MPLTNDAIADLLDELADREAIQGTRYKPNAYRRAARNIRSLEDPLEKLREQDRISAIDGVGDAIQAKIHEALDTGTIDTLERLRDEVPVELDTLGRIQGLGPKKLATLWQTLDITTLDDLEQAAQNGQIGQLKGFGPKTVTRILDQIDHVRASLTRWRLPTLETHANRLITHLERDPHTQRVQPAAGLRRRTPLNSELLLVAATETPSATLDAFTQHPDADAILHQDPATARIQLRPHLHAELRTTTPHTYGACLVHATGNQAHLNALTEHADDKHLTLTPESLQTADNQPLETPQETDVYDALDLAWVPPEMREGRGEVPSAAHQDLPALVTLNDIRGDLQLHTTWSDGAKPIQAMAAKADALGYDYILITDHGPSLTVTGAPTLDELAQQGDRIQAINESGDYDVTVLRGVEANITRDGLDVPPHVCNELDLVLACLHDTVDDATERVLDALENNPVDIFGHPTNRLLNEREGNPLDMDRIIETAQREDIAIEINAQPNRLDLDWHHVHRYRDEVPFIVSTDAHTPDTMDLMRYGVEQARKGWLGPEHVLNTQPLDTLMQTLGRKPPA